MYVKVCGIRSREVIDWAAGLGYSAAGFVLHPASVRYCKPEKVLELARYASGRIATVAVGVSYEEVERVKWAVDYIQIYEYRETERLIFASGNEPAGLKYDYFMYDASRGSGKFSDFPEWVEPIREKLILSGGMRPGNAGRVVRQYMPFGIDVSSGVESSPGAKSYYKMKNFIEEVRNAGG